MTVDLAAAADFVLREARLLDRLRFESRFDGRSPSSVLAALVPYQNDDGGFGNALEPDIRGSASQPVPTEHALQILDDIELFDARVISSVCAWLESVTTEEGGVPFVLPTVRDGPHASWWKPAGEASLNPTAGIAGLLHKHGFDHQWLAGATEYCWRTLSGRLDGLGPDDAISALVFLEHAPGRPATDALVEALGERVRGALVALDPATPGYVKLPLEFAPNPNALARRLFDDETIELHLDAVAARQQDDGGWPITWEAPSAAAASEWRGFMTVKWLGVLRDYGRLP